MEFVIQQRDFLRGISRTHAVADKKNSMAILSNVLLSTDGVERLRLSATDLYVGVSAIEGAEIKKPGTVAVGAKTLFDIVKVFPDGDIKVSVDGQNGVELRQGKIKYRIPGFPGDDFPPLPNPEEASFFPISASAMSQLIGLTSYSMLKDETRPHLAATLVETSGETLRMVTTDGHRLSLAESSVEGDNEMRMLVPQKGVGELKRVVDDVRGGTNSDDSDKSTLEVCSVSGHAFFRRPDVQLSVRLAEEQFMPYDKIIPKKHTKRMTTSRAMLLDSLRRIRVIADRSNGGVQLHLEPGTLRIQSRNAEVGEVAEEIPVDYDGDPISVGFNVKYLVEALTPLAFDEIALELNGELDPGVIRPVGDGINFVGLIMPMRI